MIDSYKSKQISPSKYKKTKNKMKTKQRHTPNTKFYQFEWNIKQSAWIFILQGSTGRLQSSSSNQFVRDQNQPHYKFNQKYTHTHKHTFINNQTPKTARSSFTFILCYLSSVIFFWLSKQLISIPQYHKFSHQEDLLHTIGNVHRLIIAFKKTTTAL